MDGGVGGGGGFVGIIAIGVGGHSLSSLFIHIAQ